MKPAIFITGVTGFVGSHLARHLIDSGAGSVHGLHQPRTNKGRIDDISSSLERYPGDLTNPSQINQIVEEVAPDYVYHLAAISHVPQSLKNPRKTYQVNFTGTLNLLEALRRKNRECRVLLVGSSAEYGRTARDHQPLQEQHPLRPEHPYGVSKASMDLLGGQWHQQTGWPVIRTRSFPHTGPTQRARFACSSFARQVAEIEAGERSVIKVGNLDLTRDFLDVRDVVRAYHQLMVASSGVYNVCSGEGVTLDRLVSHLVDLAETEIPLEKTGERVREGEVSSIIGSNEKLCRETGWQAEISLEQTMEDLLNYWRKNIRET